MRRRAGARCHVCATGKGCPRAPMEQYWVGGGAEHTRADRSHRKSVCGPGTVPGVKHAQRSCNIPEHSSEASTGLRHAERSWNIQEHSWNIPEHSSKADEDSGMQNVLGTFRNIPRTYRIGRTHPVLHLCSLSFRTDPIPSVILFIFFFPLSILLFSFVFFLRNRPYQADSTTSRPICEVKLPRAWVVLRWGTTWEVRVLILLRVFNARSLVFHFIIIIII